MLNSSGLASLEDFVRFCPLTSLIDFHWYTFLPSIVYPPRKCRTFPLVSSNKRTNHLVLTRALKKRLSFAVSPANACQADGLISISQYCFNVRTRRSVMGPLDVTEFIFHSVPSTRALPASFAVLFKGTRLGIYFKFHPFSLSPSTPSLLLPPLKKMMFKSLSVMTTLALAAFGSAQKASVVTTCTVPNTVALTFVSILVSLI